MSSHDESTASEVSDVSGPTLVVRVKYEGPSAYSRDVDELKAFTAMIVKLFSSSESNSPKMWYRGSAHGFALLVKPMWTLGHSRMMVGLSKMKEEVMTIARDLWPEASIQVSIYPKSPDPGRFNALLHDLDADLQLEEIREELSDGAQFHLWIDSGDAPPEVVANVLISLSELHRAHGGTGLQYEVDADGVFIARESEELV